MNAPISRIDEPTHRVVWEVIDQETVRVKLADLDPEDSSDGIPCAIEPETSRTVAVTVVELDQAIEVIVRLADRDGVGLTMLRLRVDERCPIDEFRAVALCIPNWWRFRNWFPTALREAEQTYFRTMSARKASAVMFRLGLFAQVVAAEMPPQNYTVLRLE